MDAKTLLLFIALGLRLGAAFQWGVLMYWLARAGLRDERVRVLFAFASAVFGYLVTTVSFVIGLPLAISYFTLFLAYATGPMIWVTARALFRDDFRLLPVYLGVVVSGVLLCFATETSLPTGQWIPLLLGDARAHLVHLFLPQLFSFSWATLALIDVRRGAAADLVESRLRFRRTFLVGCASAMILVTTLEIASKIFPAIHVPIEFVTTPFVLVLGYLLAYQAQRKEAVFWSWAPPASSVPLKPGTLEAVPPPEEPLSAELVAKLARLLGEERVFVRPELDLSSLARALGAPEYRVRRHINQVLGYRNFNQFLNYYRVSEAKRILESPEGRDVPVYNLAMDLGFGAVSSFHRIFKGETGVTPAQYRAGTAAKQGIS